MMRFDPFRELDRLSEQAARQSSSMLSMDAVRDDHQLWVYIDLPGVASDDLDVSVEQNELTVTAERRWRDESRQVVASERPQGKFTRRLQLSEAFDMDGLEANLSDGVLEISVPVSERSRQRKVDVGGGRHSEAIETTSADDADEDEDD